MKTRSGLTFSPLTFRPLHRHHHHRRPSLAPKPFTEKGILLTKRGRFVYVYLYFYLT